jgi:hypothetical protein
METFDAIYGRRAASSSVARLVDAGVPNSVVLRDANGADEIPCLKRHLP